MTTADLEVPAVATRRQCSTLLAGSLSAPPVEEVEASAQILASLEPRPHWLEIVSRPSCERTEVDAHPLTPTGDRDVRGLPPRSAGRGHGLCCQRPGEARAADLDVFSGNGNGQIFVNIEVVRAVPEHKIVETLLDEALELTARRAAMTGHSFRSSE